MSARARWEFDMMNGTVMRMHDVSEMMAPVECGLCGSVYDSANVTVTARYSDCSVWVSPCCGRTVDDRPAGWVSRPTAIPLKRDGTPR